MVIRVSGSLGITVSRWLSFRVVDSLSWPLTVFQSLSFKLLLLVPNLLTASRWRSLRVVGGCQKVFCLFPYNTNKMTASLAVFQCRSRSLRWTRVYPSDPVVGCLSGCLNGRSSISFMFPYGRSQFLMKFQIQ